jgi:hypothetical protein
VLGWAAGAIGQTLEVVGTGNGRPRLDGYGPARSVAFRGGSGRRCLMSPTRKKISTDNTRRSRQQEAVRVPESTPSGAHPAVIFDPLSARTYAPRHRWRFWNSGARRWYPRTQGGWASGTESTAPMFDGHGQCGQPSLSHHQAEPILLTGVPRKEAALPDGSRRRDCLVFLQCPVESGGPYLQGQCDLTDASNEKPDSPRRVNPAHGRPSGRTSAVCACVAD